MPRPISTSRMSFSHFEHDKYISHFSSHDMRKHRYDYTTRLWYPLCVLMHWLHFATVSNAFSWVTIFLYFDSSLTEVCFPASNWWWISIGSANGLKPNRKPVPMVTKSYDAIRRHKATMLNTVRICLKRIFLLQWKSNIKSSGVKHALLT